MEVRKGKKVYPLFVGDMILDNGAVWMFIPKNNEILPFGDWHRCTREFISKLEAKRILKEYPNKKIIHQGMRYYKIIGNLKAE